MGRQWGFSLVEVLVTLLVVAVGLLGVAGLHARAQQASVDTYQRTQALILLDDMANRIAANRAAAGCYHLATHGLAFAGEGADGGAFACADFGTAASQAVARSDLMAWDALLDGGAESLGGAPTGAMAGARGCINDNGDGSYRVSVAWQGLFDGSLPADPCAQGLYGSEARRRVVTTEVRP